MLQQVQHLVFPIQIVILGYFGGHSTIIRPYQTQTARVGLSRHLVRGLPFWIDQATCGHSMSCTAKSAVWNPRFGNRSYRFKGSQVEFPCRITERMINKKIQTSPTLQKIPITRAVASWSKLESGIFCQSI